MTRHSSPPPARPGTRQAPWRPPTRRAFVAMLGAAAAGLALRQRGTPPAKPARPLWIGHC